MSDRRETYIYETPDNGETVYRRPVGSHSWEQKQLMRETPQSAWRRKRPLWHDILGDAPNDPALMHMLEQIEIYYKLKNSP